MIPNVPYTDHTPTRKMGDSWETKHSIRNRVITVCQELDRLYEERQAKQARLQAIEQEGFTFAKVYWMRKDDPSGKPDQLELTHSTQSEYCQQHKSRREYIGVKPRAIKAALEQVKRGQEYKQVKRELRVITSKMDEIERQIDMLDRVTFGRQQSFTKVWQ